MRHGSRCADRLENNHGLSQRNHTSRFTPSFTYFDVFSFGDRAFARAIKLPHRVKEDRRTSFPYVVCNSARRVILTSCALSFCCTALHEQPCLGGAIHVWQHSRNGPGQYWRFAIPDTLITLHSIDENTNRTVKADATGSYAFENVLANSYSLRAQHDGFGETVVGGITLAARQDLRFTLVMKISEQATTVEVTSAASQINTENGVIGDSKGTGDIGQLPLNFRASTTSPLAALATSSNVQQDSQGNVAIGGATSNMIGFSVDGISTTNVFNSAAGANPYPSPEGIAELKVTAFNNNAEFSQVGDVTFTTRGGTNNFHGSLFEYLQNDALDARVYNFTEKAPKHFNTFGGSIGGPTVDSASL